MALQIVRNAAAPIVLRVRGRLSSTDPPVAMLLP
jgi:hypothetical protein